MSKTVTLDVDGKPMELAMTGNVLAVIHRDDMLFVKGFQREEGDIVHA